MKTLKTILAVTLLVSFVFTYCAVAGGPPCKPYCGTMKWSCQMVYTPPARTCSSYCSYYYPCNYPCSSTCGYPSTCSPYNGYPYSCSPYSGYNCGYGYVPYCGGPAQCNMGFCGNALSLPFRILDGLFGGW